ncbi:hypothetical protein [Pallidibacillus pasinlerensis]|uniref:Uncharacterized protein n=1 Tax=Pallidibacillus pasinlerensis TaxID=2703818 RepID=A0ABX0A2V2_9BACI|nr:hypothetical protein [Pallidibacillus pasinlerensis]NCU16620.1 hypothetical protein [Pallidibacillus pasinlerensis]
MSEMSSTGVFEDKKRRKHVRNVIDRRSRRQNEKKACPKCHRQAFSKTKSEEGMHEMSSTGVLEDKMRRKHVRNVIDRRSRRQNEKKACPKCHRQAFSKTKSEEGMHEMSSTGVLEDKKRRRNT